MKANIIKVISGIGQETLLSLFGNMSRDKGALDPWTRAIYRPAIYKPGIIDPPIIDPPFIDPPLIDPVL